MPTTDDDDDKDVTPRGLTRRLERVVDLLERANARLTRIKAGFVNPPQPDHEKLLGQIKTEAARASALADEILRAG